MIASIAERYHGVIEWIGHGTGLPDTMLHIHAGMAILILARLITGRSLGSFAPFLCAVMAEVGNEVMDRLYFGDWRWPDTTSDLGYTLFWPLVISIAVRVRPLIKAPARDSFSVERRVDQS